MTTTPRHPPVPNPAPNPVPPDTTATPHPTTAHHTRPLGPSVASDPSPLPASPISRHHDGPDAPDHHDYNVAAIDSPVSPAPTARHFTPPHPLSPTSHLLIHHNSASPHSLDTCTLSASPPLPPLTSHPMRDLIHSIVDAAVAEPPARPNPTRIGSALDDNDDAHDAHTDGMNSNPHRCSIDLVDHTAADLHTAHNNHPHVLASDGHAVVLRPLASSSLVPDRHAPTPEPALQSAQTLTVAEAMLAHAQLPPSSPPRTVHGNPADEKESALSPAPAHLDGPPPLHTEVASSVNLLTVDEATSLEPVDGSLVTSVQETCSVETAVAPDTTAVTAEETASVDNGPVSVAQFEDTASTAASLDDPLSDNPMSDTLSVEDAALDDGPGPESEGDTTSVNATATSDSEESFTNFDQPPVESTTTDTTTTTQLSHAHDTIQNLNVSKEAMASSIDALKILVENERAVTRVTKRRLDIINNRLKDATEQTRSAPEEIDKLKERIADLESNLLSSKRSEESLSAQLRVLHLRLEAKDDEFQRVEETKVALVAERRAIKRQLSEVTAQRDHCGQAYQILADKLTKQKATADRTDVEVQSLQRQLKVAEVVTTQRDALKHQVERLTSELRASKESAYVMQTEFRKQLDEKDARIAESDTGMREQTARVVELEVAAADVDRMRVRISELETSTRSEFVLAEITKQSAATEDGPGQTEKTNNAKRRAMELKIARNVIVEKDKLVQDLRNELTHAAHRAREAEISAKTTEIRLSQIESSLRETKRDLNDAKGSLSDTLEAKRAVEVNLASVEDSLEDAKKRVATADQNVEELKLKQSEYADMTARLQARSQAAESEKVEAKAETEKILASLSTAQHEIRRLENELRKNSPEEVGTSSPCSDDSMSGHARENRSSTNHLESLADLEAAAISDVRAATGRSIGTSHPADISNRPLSAPCEPPPRSSEMKGQQLSNAQARIMALTASLQRLESAMARKVEECAMLENKIQNEMKPTIDEAHKNLRKKESKLSVMQMEFGLFQTSAAEERARIVAEKVDTSKQLNQSMVSLENVQQKLTDSEREVLQQREHIQELELQREHHLKSIAQLKRECEHRKQALLVLRDRLVTFESQVAESAQKATDAQLETERLAQMLFISEDRRSVSDRRAARKDEQLFQLESKYKDLEKSHILIVAHLEEKTRLVEQHELDLMDLKRALEESAGAMCEHAKMANTRDEAQTRTLKELREIATRREAQLQATTEELTAVGQRAQSLSEALASSSEKLRTTEFNLYHAKRAVAEAETEISRREECIKIRDGEKLHLQARITSALDKISAKEGQISAHLESIATRDKKIRGLASDKVSLKKSIKSLSNEITSETSRRRSQEILVRKLEGDIRGVRAQLTSMEQENDTHSSETYRLRSTVNTLREEVRNLKDQIRAQSKKNEQVQVALSEAEAALTEAQHRLAASEDRAAAAENRTMMENNLSSLSSELQRARVRGEELETHMTTLTSDLQTRDEEVDMLNADLLALEDEKKVLYTTLSNMQKSKDTAEKLLAEAREDLSAVEESSVKEIKLLKGQLASREEALAEQSKVASANSTQVIDVSSENEQLEEDLSQSKARGERLLSRLTATEFELASEKEAVEALELKFRATHENLQERESRLTRVEADLCRSQASLASVRTELANAILSQNQNSRVDLSAIRERLEAKEQALGKLNEWCCFVNGKLRAAENALSERELELKISSEAFIHLQEQVDELQGKMREKDSQMRQLETNKVAESSELRSRIRALQSEVDESYAELDKVCELRVPSKTAKMATVYKELDECKSTLRSRDVEVAVLRARHGALEAIIERYEQELDSTQARVDNLAREVEEARSQVECRRWPVECEDEDESDGGAAYSSVQRETVLLLTELRRSKSEAVLLRKSAREWQDKAEELEPLAEKMRSAERGANMLASRLEDRERQSQRKMQELEAKLHEARQERDVVSQKQASVASEFSSIEQSLKEALGTRKPLRMLEKVLSLTTVRFSLTSYQRPATTMAVYVVGEDVTLGQWNVGHAVRMHVVAQAESAVVRECTAMVPAGLKTSYKYVGVGGDGSKLWEGGSNRHLGLGVCESCNVTDVWRD